MIVPAVALNVAVVAPEATVTEAATESSPLLLESVTAEPPPGAALLSVTVHELAAPELSVVGLQANEETSAGAARFTVAVFDELPSVAVMVAL